MKFLTGTQIWERIARLATRSGPAHVAVPYMGKGAAKMLPLKPGSVLVTRFERSAIRAGQVCPADVIALLETGVRVFNQPALHAKVYVFSYGVIIGSSNASKTSRDRLVEACIETSDPDIRSKAKQLVMDQAHDEIDLESARLMLKEYREPVGFPMAGERTTNRKRRAVRPDELSERPLWLMAMHPMWVFHDAYTPAIDAVKKSGNLAIAGDKDSVVDIMLCRSDEREKLEVGDLVLLRFRDVADGVDEVWPPAKILSIRKVRGRNDFAVAFSSRKGYRVRQTKSVEKKLGARVGTLMNLKRATRPAPPSERAALLELWR